MKAEHEVKVLVEVDMEGISGITHLEQIVPGWPEWEAARSLMTEDANAAIRGIVSAAAKIGKKARITVVDSHWAMNNILVEKLDPSADTLVRGIEREYPQLKGIDATYDAVVAIGNHDQSVDPESAEPFGILAHTWLPGWRWWVNGQEVSETVLNAYTAGEYGVPLVLVSGDDVIAEKAGRFFSEKDRRIETAVVKKAYGFQSGALKPLQEAHDEIEKKTHEAVVQLADGSHHPLKIEGPVELKIVLPEEVDIRKICTRFSARYDGKDAVCFREKTFHDAILKGGAALNMFYGEKLTALENAARQLRYTFVQFPNPA